MAIDGLSNSSLSDLAKQILENDADQLITAQELKAFVKSKESEFTGLNVDLDTVENQLMSFLKEKYIGEVNSNNIVPTGNTGGSDGTGNDPLANYNQLKSEITQYESLLDKYKDNKKTLEARQQTIKDSLDAEQKKYNALEKEISNENDDYKKIIDAINKATENLEDDIAAKQKSAAYRAMAEYDPEKDGSWSEYIEKYMSDLDISSNFTATLSGLIKDADFKSLRLDILGSKLSTQAAAVNDLSSQYKALTNEINGINALIGTTNSQLTAAKQALASNALSFVSEAEMKLVTDNNLDLTEKLDDGSPRYIIAKGKQDGQYHIYDMKNKGASVPRQYGTTGSGLRGSDICPSGNGYLRDFKKLDETTEGGEEYFYYDENNELKSARACYKTCSPLSFDLNGDGVQTSGNLVNFDIDGDGIMDTINDSADAVLVFDKDGDGISGADGSETFGNNTDIDGDGKADGFKDGFEALKALAKQEGLIDGVNDNELDENDLKVLEEKWGLKIKAGGYNSESQSLSDVGITSIKLSTDNSTTLQDNFDGNGNQLMSQEGATFTVNGEEKEYADIWHKKQTPSGGSSDSASSNNIFSSLSFDLSVSADTANASIKTSKNAAQRAKESARDSIKNINNKDTFLEYINKYDPEELNEEERKKKLE